MYIYKIFSNFAQMIRLWEQVTIFVFTLLCYLCFASSEYALSNVTSIGELVGVAVIFRHGDRTPVLPYPNDPYKNESLWPVDFGQLTNIGKVRELQLGQWFRSRYKDFLPDKYSEKDIYVRSTDVDRTLMSAEANLAGLYPPQGSQIWDQDLHWQPIPIHTIPEKEDYILAAKKPCDKYNILLKELLKTPKFVEINKKNHDLYSYLTRNSGTLINSLETVEYLYNTLFIETVFNFTLPNWTKPVFPRKMKPLAELSFAVPSYTQSMARLKTGPLITEIAGHFKDRISYLSEEFQTDGNISDNNNTVTLEMLERKSVKSYKFWMYSAHDITIANILQSLNLFEYHCPPYTSTIMFELRHFKDDYYINIFYKNSSVPQSLSLKDCEFNCPITKFLKIIEPLLLDDKTWHKECSSDWLLFTNLTIVSFAGLTVLFLLIIISLKLFICCIINRNKSKEYYYLRLQNEDP